jgi:hypothetical protein
VGFPATGGPKCLAEVPAYLDPGPARRAAHVFAALSHACHYHPYELAPAAAELTGWLDQAAQIVTSSRQRPQHQRPRHEAAGGDEPQQYWSAEPLRVQDN